MSSPTGLRRGRPRPAFNSMNTSPRSCSSTIPAGPSTRARLGELDISADETRLETELVMAAQRMDIAEEVDRLGAHVAALADALQRAEPVGRRLDFLMQEFNREANTIGSKSADSTVTAHAVEMKVLIEQMREQVQNVE